MAGDVVATFECTCYAKMHSFPTYISDNSYTLFSPLSLLGVASNRQCAKLVPAMRLALSLSLHLPDKSLIAMRSLHRRALPARKTMFDVWEFRSFEAFNFVCSFTCLIRLRRRTPETEWEAELHNYLRRLARPELGLLFVPRPLKLLDGAEFSRQYILLTDSWHLMYGSVSFGSGHLAMPSTFNLVQVT